GSDEVDLASLEGVCEAGRVADGLERRLRESGRPSEVFVEPSERHVVAGGVVLDLVGAGPGWLGTKTVRPNGGPVRFWHDEKGRAVGVRGKRGIDLLHLHDNSQWVRRRDRIYSLEIALCQL